MGTPVPWAFWFFVGEEIGARIITAEYFFENNKRLETNLKVSHLIEGSLRARCGQYLTYAQMHTHVHIRPAQPHSAVGLYHAYCIDQKTKEQRAKASYSGCPAGVFGSCSD